MDEWGKRGEIVSSADFLLKIEQNAKSVICCEVVLRRLSCSAVIE